MQVALVQVASPPEEPLARRLDRVGRLCTDADGADLVVLPELWASGFFAFDEYRRSAETLDGRIVGTAAAWARDLRCHLHLGSFVERTKGGHLFNTAVLLTPTGRIAAAYRKIHLFGVGSREPEVLTAGSSIEVAPTEVGRLGLATCYDLRFPELWRAIVDEDATATLLTAAWPVARIAHWQLLTSSRAVENQMFVIATNAVGVQAGNELGGRSRIVAPDGALVVEAGTDEGVTTARIDPSLVATVRAAYPALRDRRLGRPVEGVRA